MKKYCFALGMLLAAVPLFARTPLTIDCPPDQTSWICEGSFAIVKFTTPNVSGGSCRISPIVVCTPPSGSAFPLGTTAVDCVVVNDCGESARCSFNVTVAQDTTPPTLQPPPDLIIYTTTSTGRFDSPGYVENTITVLLGSSDVYQLTFDPPLDAEFPLGETLVTCTATDACGNQGTVTFTVTVQPASADDSRNGVDYSHTDLYVVIWSNQSEIPQLVPLDAIIMPGKLYQLQFTLTPGDPWRDLGPVHVGATGDGHFRESLFGNELYSPFLSTNAPQAFLRVKVYSLDRYLNGRTVQEDAVIGIYDLIAGPESTTDGWGNDWIVGGTGQDARTRSRPRVGNGGDDLLIGGQTGYEQTIDRIRGGGGRDLLIGGAGSDL